ncbi:MAG TPA: hypothetical protein VHC90_23905 [Bryobacteraceae bacterium]|nr:hypothetical protein [Bryobacteraceae bacterium]
MKCIFTGAAACAAFAISLSAAPPTLVSISPSDLTTDGSEIVNYTFTASHPSGDSFYLQGIDALFGDEYYCWFFYSALVNTISVWNNGIWTTEPASQPGAILHGSACDIDPQYAASQYSSGGTVLQISVQIRLGGALGTHNIYMSAGGIGGISPYQKMGIWTVTPPAPFTLTVTPPAVFTRPGEDATATATIADGAGFSGAVNLSFGAFPNGSNLTGSFSPASITGNGTATLTIHTTPQTPAGYDPVDIVATADQGSGERRFQFQIFVDNAAPMSSMQPLVSGTGGGDNFMFTVSDNGTAYEITGLNVLINSSVDGRNACWLWYDASANYIWLANDDGLSWQGVQFSSSIPLSNSQCSLGSGRKVLNAESEGADLSLTIPIVFRQSFGGTKNVYTRSSNFSGFESGYSQAGEYVVVVSVAPQ